MKFIILITVFVLLGQVKIRCVVLRLNILFHSFITLQTSAQVFTSADSRVAPIAQKFNNAIINTLSVYNAGSDKVKDALVEVYSKGIAKLDAAVISFQDAANGFPLDEINETQWREMFEEQVAFTPLTFVETTNFIQGIANYTKYTSAIKEYYLPKNPSGILFQRWSDSCKSGLSTLENAYKKNESCVVKALPFVPDLATFYNGYTANFDEKVVQVALKKVDEKVKSFTDAIDNAVNLLGQSEAAIRAAYTDVYRGVAQYVNIIFSDFFLINSKRDYIFQQVSEFNLQFQLSMSVKTVKVASSAVAKNVKDLLVETAFYEVGIPMLNKYFTDYKKIVDCLY